MKAGRLLAENIGTLLRLQHKSQHDLAMWCRHSDAWLSNFLRGQREVQLRDLDRIADFFGLAAYQLFQPGFSSLTDRRKGQRRSGRERRRSPQQHLIEEFTVDITRAPRRLRSRVTPPADGTNGQ